MPLVLLNSQSIQLKSYVVKSISDVQTHRRITYKFDKPSLDTRLHAIEKALAERDRLMKLPGGEKLKDKIKLYLEFTTDMAGQNMPPKRSKIYLLNGASNIDDQLQWLDVETALWVSAQEPHTTREVSDGNKTWVVIDQLFTQLYYFYS
jgi:hypothetical protein